MSKLYIIIELIAVIKLVKENNLRLSQRYINVVVGLPLTRVQPYGSVATDIEIFER